LVVSANDEMNPSLDGNTGTLVLVNSWLENFVVDEIGYTTYPL
jgi:hypothetical protein